MQECGVIPLLDTVESPTFPSRHPYVFHLGKFWEVGVETCARAAGSKS
jgi:hypothetical protein